MKDPGRLWLVTSRHPPLPQPRKQPKQQRSRLLVDSIKQACMKILQEEGEWALTPTRLVEVSGVEFGSLYQYFPNIDSVLGEICREELLIVLEREMDAIEYLSRLPLEDSLGRVVEVLLIFNRRMLQLDRSFFCRYPSYFNFTDYYNELCGDENASTKATQSLIESQPDVPKSLDTERAAYMINCCISRMIESAVENRPEYLEDPAFARDLLTMCLSLVRS